MGGWQFQNPRPSIDGSSGILKRSLPQLRNGLQLRRSVCNQTHITAATPYSTEPVAADTDAVTAFGLTACYHNNLRVGAASKGSSGVWRTRFSPSTLGLYVYRYGVTRRPLPDHYPSTPQCPCYAFGVHYGCFADRPCPPNAVPKTTTQRPLPDHYPSTRVMRSEYITVVPLTGPLLRTQKARPLRSTA